MNQRRVSSRTRWGRSSWRRLAGAAALAVVASFALRDSAAPLVLKGDAELAHTLAPWDGRITAALANDTLQSFDSDRPKGAAIGLARAALRDDPTAVDALNVLASTAQLQGDTERTRALFRYSLSLSRRELASRLWAIEEAVSRGDVRGALTNFDFALKTSGDASTILYPILANAISEPRIRAELLPILRAKPVWGTEFIDYLSRAAVNPEGTAALYPQIERAGLPVSRLQHARVVDALAARSFHDQAWQYYIRIHPKADRRRSRDPGFRISSDDQTVLDWKPFNEGGLFASLVRTKDGGGALSYSITGTSSGKLAEQRQILPNGRYRLQGTARGLKTPVQERPYFAVVCDSGRELVEVPLPGEGQTSFSATFTVPASCPAQSLALIARQVDDPRGLEGEIESAEIVPLD